MIEDQQKRLEVRINQSAKGTVIRLELYLSGDSEAIVVHPLKYSCAGVILNANQTFEQMNIPGALDVGFFHVIDHDAAIVDSIPVGQRVLERIVSVVLYPDGSTWCGRIFKGQEDSVPALVWDYRLTAKYKDPKHRQDYKELPWEKVPSLTTVIVNNGVGKECQYILHKD